MEKISFMCLLFATLYISTAMANTQDALTLGRIHSAAKYIQGEKIVAITFDDGPNPKTTPGILKILDKYQAKATFFMLGQNVVKNPLLVQEVARRGHDIGNHSFSHPNLSKLSTARITSEVIKTQDALLKVGVKAHWFRPPYGAGLAKVAPIAKASHLTCALWSVDTKDWKQRTPTNVDKSVMETVKSGDVILLHDTKKVTLASLDSLLSHLRAKGYRFVTLSQWEKEVRSKKGEGEDPSTDDSWEPSDLDEPLTVAVQDNIKALG